MVTVLLLWVVRLQPTTNYVYSPCAHSTFRRQHQTRTFTDHARSEGKPSPTRYLYVDNNPDKRKDYPWWCAETDLFNGLVSQFIIFGMVRNDAFNGSLTRNPFNFHLFGLHAIRLTASREETPYSALDVIGGKKIDGYNTLFSGSGDINCGHGLDIDREDWENGYGLFRFDSTPAGSRHPNYLVPRRSDNVNWYLNFHTPTPAVINLIVYVGLQNQLEIDRNRRVMYDLSQGSS